MSITITNFQNTKYYGIYDDGGTWTQADGVNVPTHFAVLDEIPTENGIYSGTVYAEDAEVEAVDYTGEIEVYFIPDVVGLFSGVFLLAGGTVEDGATSGEGVVFDAVELDVGVDVCLSPETFALEIENGDFVETKKFDTLIYTLLFTNARASRHEVEVARDRDGWIDDFSQNIFRSRLWLKDMARITTNDLNQISEYCNEALQYMVEKAICSNIQSTAIKTGDKEVGVNITIETGSDVLERYVPIWREI